MDNPLTILDIACETGNHVPFIHAMFGIFRTLPKEKVFSICLAEARICLQIPNEELPKDNIYNMIVLLEAASPSFRLLPDDFQNIDCTLCDGKSAYHFVRAMNELVEAATKTDIHWQGSLLERAYHRMTMYRILSYRFAHYPNQSQTEIWSEPEFIAFRKSIFEEFRQKFT